MKISKIAEWKNRKQTRFLQRLHTDIRQTPTDQKQLSMQLHTRTTRTRKQLSNTSISKKTLSSFRNIVRKTGVWIRSSSKSINERNRTDVVKNELEINLQKIDQIHIQMYQCQYRKLLDCIFCIGETINQNFYSYKLVEHGIKSLNQKVKELKSVTAEFYSHTVSGLILYEYSSFSLTIFYFDRALKCLSIKNITKFDRFDRQLELQIYKYASKVFLQIKKLKQAKDMAYMYLRKAWRYRNIDEEFSAYDLLGQVQLEDGNIQLSRYFHWRMCHAVREEKQILQMSNQQLDKNQHRKMEFSIFQDIMQFVRGQQQIVGILSNHFRSEAEQQGKGFKNCRKSRQIFMYTHKSPNRVLRNHRVLERRLIDQKESIQLHFIRSKDIKRLRKIITQFNSFIFDLKRKMQTQLCKDQINFFD